MISTKHPQQIVSYAHINVDENFLDPFTVLGLSPTDTFFQIKKAYRSLALKFHPDKNPSGNEKFLLVRDSFQKLKELREEKESILKEVRCGFAALECPNGEYLSFESRKEMFQHVKNKMIKMKDKVSYYQSINSSFTNL